MKVLVIWKALVSESYHKRFIELAKFKDVELTLVVPTKWHNIRLEKEYCSEYKIIPRRVVLNGSNHFHWYPGLEKIIRQVRPDILHIEEEHYSIVTYQAIRLAKKYNIKCLFVSLQNIYKIYPFPFSWIEKYNMKNADYAVAVSDEIRDVLIRKGFDKEHIVIIKNVRSLLLSKGEIEIEKEGYEFYREQRFLIPQTFKQELLKHSHILNVTVARPVPGGSGFNWWMDCHPEGANANEKFKIRWIGADPDYIETFGLKLITGRNYSTFMSPMAPDSPEGIVINETAVEYFGWTEPLGKNIIYQGSIVARSDDGKTNYTYHNIKTPVIGVIKDFHFKSLHTEIQPLGLWPGGLGFISVKIQPDDIPGTLEFLEKTWNSFAAEVPFKYSFLAEDLDKLYSKEERLGKIFLYFTILAILIACLGLFGLASFTAEQRTKEIGVRKVLGASVQDIIKLLSKTYIILIIIANLIAWPIGYIAMHKWLQNFAYRINFGIGIFLLTGLIALIIVIIAVSSQAIKASLTDPVESLRYE